MIAPALSCIVAMLRRSPCAGAIHRPETPGYRVGETYPAQLGPNRLRSRPLAGHARMAILRTVATTDGEVNSGPLMAGFHNGAYRVVCRSGPWQGKFSIHDMEFHNKTPHACWSWMTKSGLAPHVAGARQQRDRVSYGRVRGRSHAGILRQSPDIDVVVSDIYMPTTDGIEFLGSRAQGIRRPALAAATAGHGPGLARDGRGRHATRCERLPVQADRAEIAA